MTKNAFIPFVSELSKKPESTAHINLNALYLQVLLLRRSPLFSLINHSLPCSSRPLSESSHNFMVFLRSIVHFSGFSEEIIY